MAFRMSTLLKSIDLQCGHRVVDSPSAKRIMTQPRVSPPAVRRLRREFGSSG